MIQTTPELEQARYWRNMLLRGYANRGTIAGFIESCAPLRREDGPLAREYLRLARWLKGYLKQEGQELEKAVRRAARHGWKAPVYDLSGYPWVRADYISKRTGDFLVWHCPYCGQRHSRPWELLASRRELLPCDEDSGALCVLKITPLIMPLLIPCYIPPPRSA
jgi:hypothetical protein